MAIEVLTITLAWLALAAAEPTATQTSQVPQLPNLSDFHLDRELSNYKTYAWNKSQAVSTESMANHLRIINAVQGQMKERGYRIDTVNPEVRIQYRLELRQRVEGASTQQRSVWDDANAVVQIDFNTVKQAHFSIQFVEADSNFFLWQTEGTYPLGTPDRAEIMINEAVEDLFKRYPSQE